MQLGLDLEHVVGEREHVRERRPRLEPVAQHHDPAVVGAELELALGEDHPARELAAELRLAERLLGPGQQRARQRDRDRRAGAEVPRAADDLARLALPHVDPAELEPVGVRVLAGLEHLADEEAAEVAVVVGTPRGTIRSTSQLVKTSRRASSSTGTSKSTYSRSQESGTFMA